MKERLVELLGCIRAANLWFHGAHHCAKGTGFVGDHKDLYGEIYSALSAEFDQFVERAMGLTGDEMVADPLTITQAALGKLKLFPSPSEAPPLTIVLTAIAVIEHHLGSLELTYHSLKDSGEITLGLDDLLMSTASAHETNLYLLQQRAKIVLEA